ncbi:glycine-rich cell wall structural protein 1.8-like protein [Dinothrombium tinctorium]|uniref:Glycine-rich cell wall structural protein 1.8-like protein n=1 Tax=Dinothrombium tinctorium TaxID=1965070 RepID=A0A443QYT2_9ACAR|nr:glycine-rich cell wall structural protein 1.8-like protein [Dinothrombium tinctorium]
MHRFLLVLILQLTNSCLALDAKDSWWNNLLANGETRTSIVRTKASKPTVQLTVGTAMGPKKWESSIQSAAQTPEKFWQSKSFESLLRENQRDGLDIENVAPFKQSFKSWEYTKEGNKPGKLIEKSWEKTGDILVPPTVKVIENTEKRTAKVIRWDDKPEFTSAQKFTKNIQKQQFLQPHEQDNPKAKIVSKKLIKLKKTLETEDIPIDGIVNSKHESTRIVKKDGVLNEPNTQNTPLEKRVQSWFKKPSATTEKLSTPKIDYAYVSNSPKRARKSSPSSTPLPTVAYEDQEQDKAQIQQGTPKLSFRFQWGKRSDEEQPKNDDLKDETPTPITEVETVTNDGLKDIKELEEFQAKWENLARRTFTGTEENVDVTTTPLPARQKKPKVEKSNRQVKLRETNQQTEFERNTSAKGKSAKLYSWSSSIDHGSYKEDRTERPRVVEMRNEKIQKKSGESNERRSKPARVMKRIDDGVVSLEGPVFNENLNKQQKQNYEIEEIYDEKTDKSADQRERGEDHGDEGKEWRLEDSIPGVPDQDYATHKTVPQTSFKCSDHQLPGYYGDPETKCQIFHICQADGRQDSFVCPIGTMFNQQLFVCDWWNNVRCDQTAQFYELNSNLYDYGKEGKPRSSRRSESESEAGSTDPSADEPTGEVREPLKDGSSIYRSEQRNGGTHQNQVYFAESPNMNAQQKMKFARRKASTEKGEDSQSSQLSDDERSSEYENDDGEEVKDKRYSTFATRLSSLRVK